LSGPAVFVVNDSIEVYVRQETQRSFSLYGANDKSGSTDGQSQRKFENERCTDYGDISRQKRQRVNIYRDISTLAPFISIACLQAATACMQLAFPHVESVKYNVNKGASLCV